MQITDPNLLRRGRGEIYERPGFFSRGCPKADVVNQSPGVFQVWLLVKHGHLFRTKPQLQTLKVARGLLCIFSVWTHDLQSQYVVDS